MGTEIATTFFDTGRARSLFGYRSHALFIHVEAVYFKTIDRITWAHCDSLARDMQTEVVSSLPTQPNERLVYSCEVAEGD